MDVTWLVDEYLGNGKARHAAFSSKRRAIEVAGKSCDHSSTDEQESEIELEVAMHPFILYRKED